MWLTAEGGAWPGHSPSQPSGPLQKAAWPSEGCCCRAEERKRHSTAAGTKFYYRSTCSWSGYPFQSAFKREKELSKLNTEPSHHSAILLLGKDPKELKTGVQIHEFMYMNYYAHQQTKGSTKWGRPQNAILFRHEEAWSTDTCYKVDEPWKHYAEWK